MQDKRWKKNGCNKGRVENKIEINADRQNDSFSSCRSVGLESTMFVREEKGYPMSEKVFGAF